MVVVGSAVVAAGDEVELPATAPATPAPASSAKVATVTISFLGFIWASFRSGASFPPRDPVSAKGEGDLRRDREWPLRSALGAVRVRLPPQLAPGAVCGAALCNNAYQGIG